MMEIVIILLTLLVVGMCVFMKGMTELSKRIDKLEKQIDSIQYQIDDALCDINIVNKNVLDTYIILVKLKEEKIRNG